MILSGLKITRLPADAPQRKLYLNVAFGVNDLFKNESRERKKMYKTITLYRRCFPFS